jgi:O-succinylbenzoate synthase
MSANPKVYEEVVDFIARGSGPGNVVAFRPSEAARARVADLVAREKASGLTADEKSELESYLQLEHIMRLAKARAQQYLLTA